MSAVNVAILIDAENVQPSFADQIFTQAASMGEVTHKEIFGAAQALNTWVEPVLKYAIHPNLTIRPSKYKNSSDIALVIGAMDLVGAVEAVIIASSDSDFSSLSVRLRTAGIQVVGMGTENTNPLWKTACTRFVNFVSPSGRQAAAQQSAKAAPAPAKAAKPQPQAQPQKPAQQAAPQSKAAGTHAERTSIIRSLILSQLEQAGGKAQASAMFAALNALPEYRVDQQRSRRKPLNYLTRQFSDTFRYEEDDDGAWFYAVEAAPEETGAPVTGEAPMEPAEAPEEEAPQEEPAREAEEPARPEMEEEPAAEAEPEPQDDTQDEIGLLVQAGVNRDTAMRIGEIFMSSPNLRSAYNKLRAAFGNTDGRKYYQLVKDIAENR